MTQLTFERREIKYLLDAPQRARLEHLMERHMSPDQYGPSTICNIYYDTPSLLLARRSAEHPLYKEKIRVRSYGPLTAGKPVFVELKKKCQGVVYKRRATCTEAEARALLSGRAHPTDQIGRELSYAIGRYEGLAPMCYLAYDREAFYDPCDHEFRMTFDRNVRARWDDLTLAGPTQGTRLLPEDMSILEVKCLGALPLWLVGFLSEERIFKGSFSKYGAAVAHRDEVAAEPPAHLRAA